MSCLYQIKNLTLHELPEIMDIGRRAYNISWSDTLMGDTISASHTKTWGIFDDNNSQCLGFVILSMIIDESDLLMICIDPKYQRKGFGSQLLSFIIDNLKSSKVENIYIEVRNSNHRAIKMFEKHNFTRLGLRKDYYPGYSNIGSGREDAVIMGLAV
jgi:[ribosomal protein S18]-alanine N-acetyltransferase